MDGVIEEEHWRAHDGHRLWVIDAVNERHERNDHTMEEWRWIRWDNMKTT